MPASKKTSDCGHIQKISPLLSWSLINTKRMSSCKHCGSTRQKASQIWLCLYCLSCYCCSDDEKVDHSHDHWRKEGHPVAVNVSSKRFWCYQCGGEVYTGPRRNSPEFIVAEETPYSLTDRHWQSLSGSQLLDTMRPRGLVGLGNLGNTCYMNSALQCLSNCHPLTTYFLSIAASDIRNSLRSDCSDAYRSLMVDIWSVDRPTVIAPNHLLKVVQAINPSFRGYMQQDTQEFLRCLLDQLHEELKDFVTFNPPEHRRTSGTENQCSVEYKSFIGDLFNGHIRSSVKCLTCDRKSVTKEIFQDLSLPIPTGEQLKRLHDKKAESSGTSLSSSLSTISAGSWISVFWSPVLSLLSWGFSLFSGFGYDIITLTDCLDAFFSPDELTGENMYSCEKCQKLRNGRKEICITHLPDILCIHLKRFRHESLHSSKINSYVSFPLHGLSLSPHLAPDSVTDSYSPVYNLTGVICHHGSDGGGHYTSYCKHPATSAWYEYNDSYVSSVSSDEVERCQAYVLFYKRDDAPSKSIRNSFCRAAGAVQEPSLLRYYISKSWLVRFLNCADPGPISNSVDFLCAHGFIRPSHSDRIHNSVIALSSECWELLHTRHGGGPAVNTLTVCPQCQAVIEALRLRQKTEKEEFLKRNKNPHNRLYAISNRWYRKWEAFVEGTTDTPPGKLDNRSITENLRPSSGRIAPVLRRKADYIVVNGSIWRYFSRVYSAEPKLVYSKIHDKDSDTEEDTVFEPEHPSSSPTVISIQTDDSCYSSEDPPNPRITHSKSEPLLHTISQAKPTAHKSHPSFSLDTSRSCDVISSQSQPLLKPDCDGLGDSSVQFSSHQAIDGDGSNADSDTSGYLSTEKDDEAKSLLSSP